MFKEQNPFLPKGWKTTPQEVGFSQPDRSTSLESIVGGTAQKLIRMDELANIAEDSIRNVEALQDDVNDALNLAYSSSDEQEKRVQKQTVEMIRSKLIDAGDSARDAVRALRKKRDDPTESPLIAYQAALLLAVLDDMSEFSPPIAASMEETFQVKKIFDAAWKEGRIVLRREVPRQLRKTAAGAEYFAKGLVATTDNRWRPDQLILTDVPLADRKSTTLEAYVKQAMGKYHGGAEEAVRLFQALHQPVAKAYVQEGMGVRLEQLSVREQVQLLDFLANTDQPGMQKTFHTIHAYGLDAARAFLSCEYGKEYGDAILRIGEVLDHATASKIFSMYAGLIDLTVKTAEELQKMFLSDSSRPIDAHSVQEQLIERGRLIIHAAAQRIAQAKDPADAAEALQQELERFRSDVVLFAAVFREATKGSKTAEFKEWKGVSLETVDPQMLGTAERKKLFEGCKDVLLANWAEKGIDASAIALHGLEEGFEKKTNRTRLHLLRRDESVLAFVRFDERPDLGANALYAGSFNVDPAARGSSIGSAFFHETLKTEGKDHDIRAHVFVDDRVGTSYVEEFGFVITGVERDQATDGSTTDWFTIRRDESLNRKLKTKSIEAPMGKMFYLPDDREAMMEYVREEVSKGNVITRYRSRKDGKREVRELTSESVTVLRKTPRAPRTAHAEVPPG